MTIDVEDYFQVEAFASAVDRSECELLPHLLERNTTGCSTYSPKQKYKKRPLPIQIPQLP